MGISYLRGVVADHVISLGIEEATFRKDGTAVPESKGGLFLKLKGVADSRFFIKIDSGIKAFKKSDSAFATYESSSQTVNLVIQDKRDKRYLVPIKVKELAKKLLTSEAKVRKNVQDGTLEQFLCDKTKKLKSEILEDYQKIYDAHFKKDPSASTCGFNAKQMMKIVRTFHRDSKQSALLTFDKDKYQLKDTQFLVTRDPAQGLKIARYDQKTELGRGSFGIVYRVAQLDLNKTMALKVAEAKYPDEQKLAESDLCNEFNMLLKANEKGPVEGLQRRPHAFYNVQIGESTLVAMSGEEYQNGDGYKLLSDPEFMAASLAVKMKCCSRLLSGAINLEKLGIVHCDQKLDNTLVNKRADAGSRRFQIDMGDFAGAKEKRPGDGPIEDGTHTPKYFPYRDWLSSEGFTTKTAIFELGLIFYELLTGGQQPYPFRAKGRVFADFPDLDKPFNEQPLLDAGLSLSAIALIKRMSHPDSAQRPTALEAKTEWDKLL